MTDDSSITDVVLGKISEKFGSSETLQKIKFGRGAVGKIAVIAVAGTAALAIASLRLTPEGAVFAIVVIGLVLVCSLGAVLFVVHKQPELAVLEGMELVRYKQVTIGGHEYAPEVLSLPVPDPKVRRP